MEFFYIALSENRRSYIEAALGVIEEWNRKSGRVRIGVLVRYTRARSNCQVCKMARDRGLPVFIDNGAFTHLKNLDSKLDPARIERWLSDYASFIRSYHELFDYYALPDVPVHGRRFLPMPERKDRIKLSARLHERFLGMVPRESLAKAVPVIQGYTLIEYLDSYRSLARLGVLNNTAYNLSRDYYMVLAVGSVCVRKPSSNGKTGTLAGGEAAGTLDSFIREILEYGEIPAWGFHFFGLHREAVSKYGRHERFHASDTGAHGLNFKLKWRTFLKCRRQDEECYAKAVEHQLTVTLKNIVNTPITNWIQFRDGK